MSQALYMVELRIKRRALHGFLESFGLNRSIDEDLGYGIHAWLSATFGSNAIKPFKLINSVKEPSAVVLGYTQSDESALIQKAQEFSAPMALSAINLEDDIKTKEMPSSWPTGRKVGFTVSICPVSRKDGIEKDVFLRAADRNPEDRNLDRENVYRDWLIRQLAPASNVVSCELTSYKLVSQLRRGNERKPKSVTRPAAEFTGVLEIQDSKEFQKLLARGVGRHRAFGYGMLLLRPAR